MASYNRVIMLGNLTRKPEMKQLTSEQGVCRFSLASSRQFKNRQGVMTQDVCYIDVDVWGAQAESCNRYLDKGSPVLVEGRLKLDTWEQDGQKRSKHSIVADRVTFLGSGDKTSSEGRSADEELGAVGGSELSRSSRSGSGEVALEGKGPFDDDLPF